MNQREVLLLGPLRQPAREFRVEREGLLRAVFRAVYVVERDAIHHRVGHEPQPVQSRPQGGGVQHIHIFAVPAGRLGIQAA